MDLQERFTLKFTELTKLLRDHQVTLVNNCLREEETQQVFSYRDNELELKVDFLSRFAVQDEIENFITFNHLLTKESSVEENRKTIEAKIIKLLLELRVIQLEQKQFKLIRKARQTDRENTLHLMTAIAEINTGESLYPFEQAFVNTVVNLSEEQAKVIDEILKKEFQINEFMDYRKKLTP